MLLGGPGEGSNKGKHPDSAVDDLGLFPEAMVLIAGLIGIIILGLLCATKH